MKSLTLKPTVRDSKRKADDYNDETYRHLKSARVEEISESDTIMFLDCVYKPATKKEKKPNVDSITNAQLLEAIVARISTNISYEKNTYFHQNSSWHCTVKMKRKGVVTVLHGRHEKKNRAEEHAFLLALKELVK